MSSQATATKHEPSSSQTEYAQPKPALEQDWLQMLVGEWETEIECHIEQRKLPLKSKGIESVRTIGGLWIVAEGKSAIMDKPMTSILILGYDFEQKKYVGTWVSSCMTHLWHYEGSVDLATETLTLETEGPCPHSPGTVAKFKEVIEVKSRQHRVFTSSMQAQDGKWATIATINYRRKK
jgi:Protein of unknown function (DUF1579)